MNTVFPEWFIIQLPDLSTMAEQFNKSSVSICAYVSYNTALSKYEALVFGFKTV